MCLFTLTYKRPDGTTVELAVEQSLVLTIYHDGRAYESTRHATPGAAIAAARTYAGADLFTPSEAP